MTIHNDHHIVDVYVRSGVYSSDTIFDYSHGYVATRLFSRNSCFIMKMNKERIPELREVGRLAFERETMKKVYSPNIVWVQFHSGHSVLGNVIDWVLYGRAIQQLCSGLPLYQLSDAQPDLNLHSCARAGMPSILGVNICDKLSESQP
ncbi:gastrokine-2 [Porphyrio hochstetteri]